MVVTGSTGPNLVAGLRLAPRYCHRMLPRAFPRADEAARFDRKIWTASRMISAWTTESSCLATAQTLNTCIARIVQTTLMDGQKRKKERKTLEIMKEEYRSGHQLLFSRVLSKYKWKINRCSFHSYRHGQHVYPEKSKTSDGIPILE